MKLIIDIPDTIGKHIRESYNIHLSDATLMKVKKAIKSGTPLDKIRTEIEFEVDHRTNMLCAEDVFEIIDKYRNEVSK